MTPLKTLSRQELVSFLASVNEPAFKAKQIEAWLWKKQASSIDDMTDLSLKLRTALKQHFTLYYPLIYSEQLSSDKTLKMTFELQDKALVEGVLIPSKDRVTACVSSQVGCALGCGFCATAKLKFSRNLHYSEILDQIILINKKAEQDYGHSLTNIVYMGMGEPLLNYENTVASLDILTSKDFFGWSPKRITVSTAGIVSGISRLTQERRKIPLAVSLHTADERKRLQLMPVAKSNPLPELRRTLANFAQTLDERITVEYLLLNQINDQIQDAALLAEFCKAFPVKINLIEYNPHSGAPFSATNPQTLNQFKVFLESKNMLVQVRRSRGKDIAAACGQLAAKSL